MRTPGLLPFMPKRSNWAFDTEPMEALGGRIGYQPRGRGLGGSSAINGMVYIRGNRWDYDNWAALGCTGWGWDDVLPLFKRQEGNERGGDALHGGDGPLNVADQRCAQPGRQRLRRGGGAAPDPAQRRFQRRRARKASGSTR